ncbi:flavoprotein, partial [Desulfosporosinus sp. PR]|uniref:flavoprotein n=1 Tax=Candidatus Desulfosporosinus nitrosoreducens TaxID=3401928 RepID=UPI0027F125C6
KQEQERIAALVRELVEQLLQTPALQTLLQELGEKENPALPAQPIPPPTPEALGLLNYAPDTAAIRTALPPNWGETYTLYLLPCASREAQSLDLAEGLKRISPQEALKREWQSLFLPTCSLNTIAKMALGLRDTPFSELLGRGIAQGIPVELVSKNLELKFPTPPAYRALYESYLKTVRSYGVRVRPGLAADSSPAPDLPVRQDLRERQETPAGFPATPKPPEQPVNGGESIVRFSKKYLADKDAQSFPEGGKVLVEQRTVVSPLARDTLRLRRIELCQEKGGGGCY